jgi:type IV secretory pathway VirB3-like protein
LLQRELTRGIPQTGIVCLVILGVFFLYLLEMYFMIAPLAGLYVVMRILTKKDAYMIDILFEHINQKDVLLP